MVDRFGQENSTSRSGAIENGTLDLRTGSLRPHNPEDLITKLAPVEFDIKAKSPTFDRFLKQILVDKELIRFVQRYLGYSLTGSTKERTMAVSTA
jgi:putative DNA primase/helicase